MTGCGRAGTCASKIEALSFCVVAVCVSATRPYEEAKDSEIKPIKKIATILETTSNLGFIFLKINNKKEKAPSFRWVPHRNILPITHYTTRALSLGVCIRTGNGFW
jgi:hypothetical protein